MKHCLTVFNFGKLSPPTPNIGLILNINCCKNNKYTTKSILNKHIKNNKINKSTLWMNQNS